MKQIEKALQESGFSYAGEQMRIRRELNRLFNQGNLYAVYNQLVAWHFFGIDRGHSFGDLLFLPTDLDEIKTLSHNSLSNLEVLTLIKKADESTVTIRDLAVLRNCLAKHNVPHECLGLYIAYQCILHNFPCQYDVHMRVPTHPLPGVPTIIKWTHDPCLIKRRGLRGARNWTLYSAPRTMPDGAGKISHIVLLLSDFI